MKPEIITSIQNPRIKAVARLRDGGARHRQNAIIIDGDRELARAQDADVTISEVFHCPTLIARANAQNRIESIRASGVLLTEVTEPVFAKIGYGDRAEGIVAVAERPKIGLSDLQLGVRPLVGVVERVEKPGNLGAILRSADGAGVNAILAVGPVTDIYGPNVIRASLGTAFTVPLVEVSAGDAIGWLMGRKLAIVAAAPDTSALYTDVDFTAATAVVLGSEAEGLTPAWNGPGITRVSVPMLGRADSLNVSATAALFFYEALRQRT